MTLSIIFLAATILCRPVPLPEPVGEDRELAAVFARAGLEGTMVIESLDGRRRYLHQSRRAAQPLPVASTFKIFNTLIALEEGVVTGPESPFKWDGAIRSIPDWNRDQTLRSAFRVSCVWCYQELARRIGPDRYLAHLRRAGYGNLEAPFELTRFWLDGTLRVSAQQQVAFLRRVVNRDLPYRSSSYDELREIMLQDQGPKVAYKVAAKTGWSTILNPGIGWYVGYVETPRGVWLFALNIDIRTEADLPRRIDLARAALQAKGILP
ncbi:MAG: class D beta-lactamase [Acidobacteriota bacterium]